MRPGYLDLKCVETVMDNDLLKVGKTGPRREYRAPQLTTYGAVRELTSGGTRGETEANPGGQCQGAGLNNPNRTRC
jgi:hypothetical protein